MSREALLRRIAAEGRVSFRDAMDSALNDPEDGWYGAGKASIGAGGDFTTSPELSPLFGACVAAWVTGQWTRLGQPRNLEIVELGPGKGSLACALLDTLREEWPDVYEAVHIVLVERSESMRAHSEKAVGAHANRVLLVAELTLDRLPSQALVVSNEFFDALPVHPARVCADGRIEELYVEAATDGRLIGRYDQPSTERIAKFARCFVGPSASGVGFMFEAAIDARDWIEGVTANVSSGAILTVDYGDVSGRVAGPHRSEGSLRAMRRRQPIADVVDALWQADLTADVNFEMLASVAVANGWLARPLTTQAEWLVAMGAVERIGAAANAPLAERLAMKSLLTPGGLGERLKVLEMER